MNLNLPNLLSLARLGLVPLFVLSLIGRDPGRALAVFGIAALTDVLDGLAARFLGQVSLLGSYLDPIADKLMLAAAYVVLAVEGMSLGIRVPVWITVLVLARDVLILTVALVLYVAVGVSKFPPTPISKVNTLVQIIGVVLVLLSGLWEPAREPAVLWLWAVAALTVASGLDYLYRANQMVVVKQREGV